MAARSSPFGVVRRNSPPLLLIAETGALRKIVDAECPEAGVEGAERPQRIDVAVERAVAAAGHFRPDQRQRLLHLGCGEHLHLVIGSTGLVVHALDQLGALAELAVAEREMKAAILLKRDVQPGLLLQLRGEPAPGFRRPHGPDGIGGHAQTFALNPDQRKIRTRGALGEVAFVEHGHALAEPAEAPGNRGAEQSAADNGDVILRLLF
ncbi:hypothetical protein ABIF20_006357 [Bradyrhizobium japonicum]